MVVRIKLNKTWETEKVVSLPDRPMTFLKSQRGLLCPFLPYKPLLP